MLTTPLCRRFPHYPHSPPAGPSALPSMIKKERRKTKRLSSYRSAISQPASRRAAAQQPPVRDTTQCKEKDLNFEKLRTIKLIFFLCIFAVPVIYSLETFSYNPGKRGKRRKLFLEFFASRIVQSAPDGDKKPDIVNVLFLWELVFHSSSIWYAVLGWGVEDKHHQKDSSQLLLYSLQQNQFLVGISCPATNLSVPLAPRPSTVSSPSPLAGCWMYLW